MGQKRYLLLLSMLVAISCSKQEHLPIPNVKVPVQDPRAPSFPDQPETPYENPLSVPSLREIEEMVTDLFNQQRERGSLRYQNLAHLLANKSVSRATNVKLLVQAPSAHVSHAYEANNPATPFVALSQQTPLLPAEIDQASEALTSLRVNANWNGGCAQMSPGTDFINFQLSILWSVDGGTHWNRHANPGVAVRNGGTDMILEFVLHLPPGAVLIVRPEVRYQQRPTFSPNCVSDYQITGVLSVNLQSIPL